MSNYLKPQSPLQHKDGAFIYPLTTVDQVVLDDNTRLNYAIEHMVYSSERDQEDAVATINADTLGGYLPTDFAKQEAFDKLESIKPKAGFIYPLAGATVPEGFLLCDGAAYSRTEYKELFAAIGTIYGAGDGSTTFNVPNLQTRVPVGSGNGYELGSTGGEEKHTLTVDEMPSHAHTRGTMDITGYFRSYSEYNINNEDYANNHVGGAFSSEESYGTSSNLSAGSSDAVRKHNFKASDAWTGETSYEGGSQPHNNMQPYTVVNYIIATGKGTAVSVTDVVLGAQAIPLGVEYGGTGAANLMDARKNLGVVPSVRIVSDLEADLNDYTEEGIYYFNVSDTYKNIPFGVNGWLEVKPGSGGKVKQIFYRMGTPGTNDYHTAIRTTGSSGNWGEWTTLLTSKNGVTMKLLWENASVASFAEQTITVSENVENYDFLIVEAMFSVADQYSITNILTVKATGGSKNRRIGITSGSNNRVGNRDITDISSNTIKFGAASYNSSTNNTYVVPYKIYGVKGGF